MPINKFHSLVHRYVDWEKSDGKEPIDKDLLENRVRWDYAHKLEMCIGSKQERMRLHIHEFKIDLITANRDFICAAQYYASNILPTKAYAIAIGIEKARIGMEIAAQFVTKTKEEKLQKIEAGIESEDWEDAILETKFHVRLFEKSLGHYYRFISMLPKDDDIIKPEDIGNVDILIGQFPEMLKTKPLSLEEKKTLIDRMLHKKKEEVKLISDADVIIENGNKSTH